MLIGTVHQFEKEKGYGFITPATGEQDIFVHFSSIKSKGFKTLDVGQKVSFVVIEGKNGFQAIEVEVIPD